MHFCCLVISDKFPSDEVIEEMIEPFHEGNEENKDRPFYWDWYQIGGRYNGKFKLKVDREDDTKPYRWSFYDKEPRSGRLFRSYILEKIRKDITEKRKFLFTEEEYYNVMGYQDGYIRIDGGPIEDILNVDEEIVKCYCIVDVDGTGYAREDWDEFEDECLGILSERKNCYITTVDLHD